MSEQLRDAIAAAGPEDVQAVRLRLITAGEIALVNDDPRCLLYGALASSLSEPDGDDDVWPGLISAVYSASTLARSSETVMDVAQEMKDPTSDPSGLGVPAALGEELLFAVCVYVLKRLEGKRDIDSLDRGLPEEWTA